MQEFVEAKRSCFSAQDVRIRGWLDEPSPFGVIGPSIKPLWLAYPQGGRTCDEQEAHCFYSIALWQVVPPGPDEVCSEDFCGDLIPHVAPGSGLVLEPLERWVILTGHTHDAAAERCHWELPLDVTAEVDDAEAVAHCRRQFVVTAIEEVE